MSEIQEKINKMSNEELAMRLQVLKKETRKERKEMKEINQKLAAVRLTIAPQLDEMDRITREIEYKAKAAAAVIKRKETREKNKREKEILHKHFSHGRNWLKDPPLEETPALIHVRPPIAPECDLLWSSPPSKEDRKMTFTSGL